MACLEAAFMLLLVIQWGNLFYVQGSQISNEIAVFNSLNESVSIAIKAQGEEKIFFDNVESQRLSGFKSVTGFKSWNVTLKTGKNSGKVLKAGHVFKPLRKTILAVHDEAGRNTVLFVDAGAMNKLLGSKASEQKVGIDEAWVHVQSLNAGKLFVNWKSENCYKCTDQLLTVVPNDTIKDIVIGTKWPVILDIKSNKSGNCREVEDAEDKDDEKQYNYASARFLCGRYVKRRKRNTNVQLDIVNLSQPRNFITSSLDPPNNTAPKTGPETSSSTEPTVRPKKRLKSLDAFRGLAITVMIFVNYQGGDYYFFEHSLWNGLTVADLVFPWFIFIMGTSIDLSQRSLLSKGVRKRTIFQKILIRSVKLFAIGLFLNNGKNLDKWRIPGVLQRFGISYFAVATMNLFLSPSDETQDDMRRFDWTDTIRDIWMFWKQWVFMSIFLIVYLFVTFLVHDKANGCPRGYLGPGGIGDDGKYPNCTGGASGYIDRLVFGDNHMYGKPTCMKIYKTTQSYDPEGILGCLTSIFLTFLGLQSGRILFTFFAAKERISRWCLWGVFWGVLTFALTGGTKNEGVIPINKNLWSPSFIFATASMAYFLLAFMYFLIDVMHWWSGVPLVFAGTNAILLYCGHEVFYNFFPFNFTADPPTHTTVLARSAVGTTSWLFVAYYCYVEKIFFKV
eukprot:gene8206-14143_t